ncbi:hypothetical protein M404DRAFT_994279 [Pisolithus tinctorius Marx 270]|uniref:Uncharacterized protein n=1 Tax=Pisolithus tinctorius Marx 270 TaxID=870435 RepID=A0A0C3JQS3_PISTI|nr:hypothetical protein M404DRAFT_994279 [Pisolithus tinctorius Marx 270]
MYQAITEYTSLQSVTLSNRLARHSPDVATAAQWLPHHRGISVPPSDHAGVWRLWM